MFIRLFRKTESERNDKDMDVQEKNFESADIGFDLSETEEKKRDRGILRNIFIGLLYSVVGYLLGGCALPFGALPFGVAILCAADRRVPYILVGVCVSALIGADAVIVISAYAAVFLIRILMRLTIDTPRSENEVSEEKSIGDILPELFSESVYLRMATSCVGACIVGVYKLIRGGFLYYDLYGAIIAMAAAPTAVILLHGIFNRKNTRGRFAHVSAALLAFGVIFAAREVSVYGISLSAFGAAFITLLLCRKKGITYGIAAGIVCGLAYSPIYAPAFIFAALAVGALCRVSTFFGAFSAFSVGMAWAVYVNGVGALIDIMPALLAATLLFAVADKIFTAKKDSDTVAEEDVGVSDDVEQGEAAVVCEAAWDKLDGIRFSAAQERSKKLCETFSEMSGFFSELGEKMKKPLTADIKQICDSAFDACCGNCAQRGKCWEENYNETLAAVASISSKIHREGRLENSDLPESVRDICERVSDIVDEINHNYTMHTKQLLLCDKTEIFALDYEAVSDLIAGAMVVDGAEYECDGEASAAICERLGSEIRGIRYAVVYGSRKKRILVGAADASDIYSQKEKILDIAREVCGSAFACGEICESEGGGAVVTLEAKRRFCAEVAKRSVMSDREEDFCGDTVCVFGNTEDKTYSLISDGMGSGRDAALTSGICAMFIQKMLCAANRCDTSLKMLNSFLRNKGGGSIHECSATVDLLELDLIYGKASFYKSGAAPTYVYRSGGLFKLRSKTVPVGIIKELDAKKISFDVGEGDVIVMVSDGVTQGREECPWLFDLLKRNVECEGIERTADMIVERARRECADDDISVVVIRVREEK